MLRVIWAEEQGALGWVAGDGDLTFLLFPGERELGKVTSFSYDFPKVTKQHLRTQFSCCPS